MHKALQFRLAKKLIVYYIIYYNLKHINPIIKFNVAIDGIPCILMDGSMWDNTPVEWKVENMWERKKYYFWYFYLYYVFLWPKWLSLVFFCLGHLEDLSCGYFFLFNTVCWFTFCSITVLVKGNKKTIREIYINLRGNHLLKIQECN